MQEEISYVWVTKGDSIPHKEKTHGMLNIVNTAQKNPNSQINVYVDSEKKQISYTLPPNIDKPKNIKFIPVSHLVTECIIKALENKHNPKFIDDSYQLYLLEMKDGHPAYAGNFIKLLALYKGGFVSDIGVIYDREMFLGVKNIGENYKPEKFIDDKFHITSPVSLCFSSDSHNESVRKAIIEMNGIYKDSFNLFIEEEKNSASERLKWCFCEDKKQELSKLFDEISKLKPNKDNIMECVKLDLELGIKLQDDAYGVALGFGTIAFKIPKDKLHHKMSHLSGVSCFEEDRQDTIKNNQKLEEEAPGSSKKTSDSKTEQQYVFQVGPNRSSSAPAFQHRYCKEKRDIKSFL